MQITDVQNKTTPILSTYGVKKAALFGSTARNEASAASDVDVLVELGRTMSLFEFIELKQKLEDVLQRKVDLVQYKKIKPALKSFILKDEKVFFQL